MKLQDIRRPLYYDRQGKPYPGNSRQVVTAWAKDFNDKSRLLKQNTLPNGVFVSTVWLGLDHSFSGGPPLIFETMVFPANSLDEKNCQRYSTEAEALQGHQEMVEKWKDLP